MNRTHAMLIPVVLLLLAVVIPAHAVQAQVKSFEEVTGFEFGERITQHHEMHRYLRHLDNTSDRVQVVRMGESVERRDLVMAIVTSPENHDRLDEIKENAQLLGDPRRITDEQAEQIMEGQPSILYLGGSIHGFELSGADGILKLLEELTVEDGADVQQILENTVVLIDPILNPDGRDAFAQFNHRRLGSEPNPERDHWANDFTSWEGLQFRTSHYYFDINRDWFALTHPETRNRASYLQQWRPQAGVDAHEMGSDVEYFFDPPTDPVPGYFPEYTSEWFVEFGNAYAEAFDREGFEYMTRERYNYFYPGYTTAYLTYQGAVGMLYEQGSSRGLSLRRFDDSVRDYIDAVTQQYTSARAAANLMAERREEILRDYYQAHRSYIADGQGGVRRYLIEPEGDPNHLADLVDALTKHGIEVHRLNEQAQLSGVINRSGEQIGSHTFPEGTFVIEASQPRNRYIRTLLEPEVPVPEDFLEEARERIDRGESPRFYDITSWSLPLLFNLQGYSSTDGSGLDYEMVEVPLRGEPQLPDRNPDYAYMIDGSQASGLGLLKRMRDKGYRATFMHEPTRIEGTDFASGSLVFRVGQNDETLHDTIREMARHYEVDVEGVDTGLSPEGFPALGSGDASRLVKETEIALLAEDPFHGYSFGWAWFTLDQQYDVPLTILRAESLAGTPLDRFNVIVMPRIGGLGALEEEFGERGMQRLKDWVQDGGTLVTLGNASDFARENLGLTDLRSLYEAEEYKDAQRFNVPGAFFRGELNPAYWLSSGYVTDYVPFKINSSAVYREPEGSPSFSRRTPVKLAGEQQAHIAGHAWPESHERLPESPVVYEELVGSGRVISFAEDINFRGYWRGADRLFLNAVILGPSAP